MRHAIRPFTVEVRRRPRLATASETKLAPPAFDPESQRAAAMAFGATGPDRSSVDVAASHPRGRILPSLVPDELRRRLLEDGPASAVDSEPPSRGPRPLSVRARKRAEQGCKAPRHSNFSSDENAPLAVRSSTKSQGMSNVQSDEGAGATPTDAPRAPSQVVGDSRSLTPSAKGRKRTIMARYVFGDEDKPGARWKRRLLRSR